MGEETGTGKNVKRMGGRCDKFLDFAFLYSFIFLHHGEREEGREGEKKEEEESEGKSEEWLCAGRDLALSFRFIPLKRQRAAVARKKEREKKKKKKKKRGEGKGGVVS